MLVTWEGSGPDGTSDIDKVGALRGFRGVGGGEVEECWGDRFDAEDPRPRRHPLYPTATRAMNNLPEK